MIINKLIPVQIPANNDIFIIGVWILSLRNCRFCGCDVKTLRTHQVIMSSSWHDYKSYLHYILCHDGAGLFSKYKQINIYIFYNNLPIKLGV